MTVPALIVRGPELARRSDRQRRQISGTSWSTGEATLLVMAAFFSAGGILAGWYGTAHSKHYSDQVGWLVLAGASLILLGFGAANWLLSGMRAIRIRSLELRYRAQRLAIDDDSLQSLTAKIGAPFRVAPGMVHFHNPDCILLRNKAQISPTTAQQAFRAALLPCGVCEP